MLVRTWRLVTILLTALSMGLALAHLLEMPAKITYEGALWLRLKQTLYHAFGTVGAFFEVGAVLASVVLAFLVRHRPGAFGWTLFGALCLVAMHAVYWLRVAPVNATIVPLTPDTLPADWTRLRDQWEHTHALRAVLQVVAVGAFVWSILVETPTVASGERRT